MLEASANLTDQHILIWNNSIENNDRFVLKETKKKKNSIMKNDRVRLKRTFLKITNDW